MFRYFSIISVVITLTLGASLSANAERVIIKTFQTASKPNKGNGAVTTGDVIDHAPFEALLKKHVDARGMVNYKAWREDIRDVKTLGQYVQNVGKASVEGKSDAARLAFYINAYNALVLHTVLERWPVENVLKEEGFFKAQKHVVAQQSMTLDELEHTKVIRKQFNEPRIHFVLVCAAKSCPRLLTTALTEANLEAILEAATREFIPKHTRLEGKKVVTSQLFNWFAEDFTKASGSVRAYIAGYVDEKIARALRSEDVAMEFSEYDWSINSQ